MSLAASNVRGGKPRQQSVCVRDRAMLALSLGSPHYKRKVEVRIDPTGTPLSHQHAATRRRLKGRGER